MAERLQYAAFISYSSADARFAARLHRALESYGIPAALGTFDLLGNGAKPNRIFPVFRDREELSAGKLSEKIEAGLRASGALIVVCSPNAAQSSWVQKEIEAFAALGRTGRIFAVIAEDAPLFDATGADATTACFPEAFRSGGALEPLAGDARKGKDGFRKAWLKIVAGLIGVTPGQIIDRDKKRRRINAGVLGAIGAVCAAALAYGGYQALRPVSLRDCPIDRLTFTDPWGNSSFRVARAGEYAKQVCEGGPECRHAVTVFEGDYTSDPREGFNGRVFYTYSVVPGSAPCCTWDAATSLSDLGDEANGPDMHWFARGQAPRLGAFPFSSIEMDDLTSVAAQDTHLRVTFNPLIAQSCRSRGL